MSVLPTYVAGWRDSVEAVLSLVDGLDPETAATPTDCPGWTVHDVVAHLAHLESVMCADASDEGAADVAELPAAYTGAGVAERRDRPLAEVVAELRAAIVTRSEQLRDLPDEADQPAPVTPGGIAWSWDVLLRNRTIDVWVHEQDVRRALGRPGGLDSTAAQVVTMAFSFAMPFVLGKRVRPPAGTTVRWLVSGEVPVALAVRVGEDGRAHRIDEAGEDVTTLRMSTETFTVLAAGRRSPDEVEVSVDGDDDLARAVLAAMAVTP
jgi:uncharacterized protein (TIGR03083 family)